MNPPEARHGKREIWREIKRHVLSPRVDSEQIRNRVSLSALITMLRQVQLFKCQLLQFTSRQFDFPEFGLPFETACDGQGKFPRLAIVERNRHTRRRAVTGWLEVDMFDAVKLDFDGGSPPLYRQFAKLVRDERGFADLFFIIKNDILDVGLNILGIDRHSVEGLLSLALGPRYDRRIGKAFQLQI